MPTTLKMLSDEFALLASAVAPSVVSVHSARSRWSGFVWRPGLIVTADERLSDEGELSITAPDGSTATATIAGRDASTDIAVLRTDIRDIRPITLGPCNLTPGALVLGVGGSGAAMTVSLGAVCARSGPWRSMRGGEIDARIELDVRLRQNAEGGVAVDAEGGVLGMMAAGPRRSVLVIPSATIDRVAEKLAAHGRIPRGYLGLGLHLVSVSGGSGKGAMVMNVDPSGPGSAAGIHQGDVLIGWDGKPVGRIHDLLRSLGPDSLGRSVSFDVRRGGPILQMSVRIAERPAA